MTPTEIKNAIMALDNEEKKRFIIEALPDLAKDAIKEPGFLMELLPVFLGILKESGIDLQQMLQFAAMMGGNGKNPGESST